MTHPVTSHSLRAVTNAQPALLDATTYKSWPFGLLEPHSYDFLMVDPPWRFENYSAKGEAKSANAHYDTMTLDEIKALPVGQLARPDAVIMLWISAPLLLDKDNPGVSPVGEILQAWGFRYGSVGGWVKKTINDKNSWGTGYVVRSGMELFLLGVTGSPEHSKGCLNHFDGLRREHSRKPESAYDWVERYMPGKRYCDLFSRQNREDWDSWGRETGKFDETADGEKA